MKSMCVHCLDITWLIFAHTGVLYTLHRCKSTACHWSIVCVTFTDTVSSSLNDIQKNLTDAAEIYIEVQNVQFVVGFLHILISVDLHVGKFVCML